MRNLDFQHFVRKISVQNYFTKTGVTIQDLEAEIGLFCDQIMTAGCCSGTLERRRRNPFTNLFNPRNGEFCTNF